MLKKLNIGTFWLMPATLLLVSSLFLLRERSIVGHLGFPLDDAWIHLKFARNFSQGLGFCFNPGEPVAGSTGPLWTALLGLQIAVFGASPGSVKVLGLILLCLSGVLSARLARQVGIGETGAAAVAILLVVTPRMQWAALSGMELMLAILLSLGGFLAWLQWRGGGGAVWALAAGVLFGLAGWARPEALVLAGGPGIDLLVSAVGRGRRAGAGTVSRRRDPWSPLLSLCLGFAVSAGFLFWFNFRLSGGTSVLPSTFGAKTLGLSFFDRAGGESLIGLLLQPLQTFWPVVKYMLLPDNLILAMFLPCLFRKVDLPGRDATMARPLWIALLLLPYLRALLTGETANFQQYGRYLAVLTPIFLVLGILAVQRAFASRSNGRDTRAPGDATPGALIAIVFSGSGALGLYYLLKRNLFGMGHQWPQAGDQWYLPFLAQAGARHVAVFSLVATMALVILWMARRRIRSDLALGGLLVFVLAISVSLVEDWQVATEVAWNVRNIDRTQVRIGRWLNEETPDDAVVATNDIGAIGYFSRRRVIDMVGLVTPGMLERLKRSRDRDAAILEYFRRDRPDYVVIFDDWYPGIARRADLLEERLRVLIERNLTCGSPATREMAVYRWTARPPSLPAIPSGLELPGSR